MMKSQFNSRSLNSPLPERNPKERSLGLRSLVNLRGGEREGGGQGERERERERGGEGGRGGERGGGEGGEGRK